MKLAISNIAWDISEDQDIATLLRQHAIDAIDVAPGKYFPDPAATTAAQIDEIRKGWAEHGIGITGMQALLFGTQGLNLFGSIASQAAMLKHLRHICRIGAGLGATRLVFGSPKNRDRSGLDDEHLTQIYLCFFRALGDIAREHGVTICLEPNPVCYGANFMTDTPQTAQVVREVDHPHILMQLDTGSLTINDEDPFDVLDAHAELIGHVHASERDLQTLGDGDTDHVAMATALNRHLPRQLVSIEMLPNRHEPHPVTIERALNVAIHHYRNAAVEMYA
ncbi:sugar phosphate isomerase/epimerase family protein [Pseudomonas sp. NPDC090202]|uniref:sugar phosphate isomerase/epimerase family protein n=1 Tax=unclassified Pseudomonas TaxID=196821 RepID=UPI00380F1E74